MIPFDIQDSNAAKEIKAIQEELEGTIHAALLQENNQHIKEAVHLYQKAQRLSIYSNKSLKPKIWNEEHDAQNWNQLDTKIKELKTQT